jgi:hypothetical protein
MCVLCAAVPATLAFGAAEKAKKTRALKRAGVPARVGLVPVSVAATLAAFGFVLAAVFYHTRGPSG